MSRFLIVFIVAAQFCLTAGCQKPASDTNQQTGSDRNSATDQSAVDRSGESTDGKTLPEIAAPQGSPATAEELARHIHFAIQESDRQRLIETIYQVPTGEFQVQKELMERLVDDLIEAKQQGLIAVRATRLTDAEIEKRINMDFGMAVPLKLVPGITHEITFEYAGRLRSGTSRPSSVNVGPQDGVYYVASYFKGSAAASGDD